MEAGSDAETLIRVYWLRAVSQTVPAPAASIKEAGTVRVELLVYSLDRQAARRVLKETADSAQSHAAVRDLLGKGQAQLEVLTAIVTTFGQRAVVEQAAEVTFPSGMRPPAVDQRAGSAETRQPASFTMFETRNTGVTVEVETVIDPDGKFTDINIVPQIVQVSGMLTLGGVAAKYPPQPVFTTRKITTSATSAVGVPVFLGTMSRPRENGVNDRKDDGRTSLAYVRVTPSRP
jgi:hypothetical protein